MDAVPIAIIITVLTLGSALIYLFKSEFDRRQAGQQQQQQQQNGNKKHSNAGRAQQNGKNHPTLNKAPQANKQVPYITSNNLSNATQAFTITNLQSTPVNHNNRPINSQPQQQQQQNEISAKSSSQRQALHPVVNNKANNVRVAEGAVQGTQAFELYPDELDSSIMLDVLNTRPTNGKQIQKKEPIGSLLQIEKRSAKKRKQATNRTNNGAQSVAYSSEQLFNIIAASNLSRDEIELAVECLLNKIDSGESDWQPSKGDPLQRLKNQLKDVENALNTEMQNHELTRSRLTELKNQIQNERSLSGANKDELSKLRKEFNVVTLALEQGKAELAKQLLIHRQLKEDSAQVINKLEQDKLQLQNLLANTSVKDSDTGNLRNELDDKINQLQRYELSNMTMSEKIEQLEVKLRNSELQLDQMQSSKHHDNYEACAKISELESECMRLDKTVKDHVARLKDMSETNCLLEKSLKDVQIINSRQEDMIKRLRDERYVNETSMKQTLSEMEQELKELQAKLTASAADQDEKNRRGTIVTDGDADEQDQRFASNMRELREGLSTLFPDIAKDDKLNSRAHDWIHAYLDAVKQLAKTVTDLRFEPNNNNQSTNNNNDSGLDSPSKLMKDKSTLTPTIRKVSSRVSSPTSNGRSSRAGSHYDSDNDKKVMETKLVELNDHVAELDQEMKNLLDLGKESTNSDNIRASELKYQHLERQVYELKSQRSKLEAQIKFGIDSLKMEQERAKSLEDQLADYKMLKNIVRQSQ